MVDGEGNKKHWHKSSPITNQRFKLRIRARRNSDKLRELDPNALSLYEFYSKRLKDQIKTFRYYQPVINEYLDVEGVARRDLDKVLDVSRVTIWSWLKRNFFVEPSLSSVKKTPFYLKEEVEMLIKFLSNSFYRRLPKTMEQRDLEVLHDCFLIPRNEFFNRGRK